MKTVSAVIITHSRLEHLKKCLKGLDACEPTPLETIVVITGPDPVTRAWLSSYSGGRVPLRWFESAESSKGQARNEGVRRSIGEFIYFLDDDAIVPATFFRILDEKIARYPNAEVLGGPNLTPTESSSFQKTVGFVLESWWGAGRMRARYRSIGQDHEVDDRSLILCNLVIRRSLFQRGDASFHPGFFYNEENLLLEQLKRRGVRMMYCPSLSVYHGRRERWRYFLRQVWHSGVGRGMMTRLFPRSLRADFVVPSVFLLYLVSLPMTGFLSWVWGPLLIYGFLGLVQSVGYFRRVEPRIYASLRVVALTLAAHLVYGFGFIIGCFRCMDHEIKDLDMPTSRG